MSSIAQIRSNWFTKFLESLLAAIAVSNFLLGFITLLPQSLMKHFPVITISSMLASVLFSLAFSFYWHRKAKTEGFDSAKCHAWFHALLRYWLAFSLAIYGFAKLFDAQFVSSFHRSDSLVNMLSGMDLTWNYFAFSYKLSAIIGFCQIFGGVLLLFRRTTLLGVAILLPIMFNIVLINIFYSISIGAFINSLLYTLGLFYLLTLNRNYLIDFFWNSKSTLPKIGNDTLRSVARVFSIFIACGFVVYASHKNRSSAKFVGKWKVETMIRNGKTIPENAWQKDTLAWKVIYIEERKEVYYCPNPYLYDENRSLWMKYNYDEANNTLKVISYERNEAIPDTIPVQVNKYNSKSMLWEMVLYKDTIQMQLKKVNK